MFGNLINLPVEELLKKLGAGGHKPGAGSAAALQGLIAAQLIKTVIDLSKDKKDYKNYREELIEIKAEIEDDVYPGLQNLLQEDSNQFDKVIVARNNRDEEKDPIIKNQLSQIVIDELKIAINIPLNIAKQCLLLGEHATYVFDNGFQSARGDSSVAINCALSAIAGCLSIIDLNLLSLSNDEWTEHTRHETDSIRTAYLNLVDEGSLRYEELKEEAAQVSKFYSEISAIKSRIQNNPRLTSLQLEDFVRRLQLIMWDYRTVIWKKNVPKRPLDILNPEKILKKLGYQFIYEPSLGFHDILGGHYETAGLIDSQNKYVAISEGFSPETQLFTSAHELGHALLHPGQSLHRDRPLDGSTQSGSKDIQEIQADRFAACFLMPRKQVIEVFKILFLTNKFAINEYTAIGLGIPIAELRKKCKSIRDLSRLLATAEYFYQPFNSIADQFRTSEVAMAIRLEECGLLAF